MEKIRPNNNKSKQEKKKYSPVVKKAEIVSSKKSITNRIIDTFLDNDVRDIKSWLIEEVIVPGLKDTFLDLMSMALTGEAYRGSKRKRGRYDDRGRVNYGGYYSGDHRSSKRRRSRERSRYYEEDHDCDYRAIVLKSRAAAEDIVDKLRDIIRDDGDVSVATFFELLDIASSFNDNNWGWTREHQIGIRSVRDGFLIDVDEAEYIG